MSLLDLFTGGASSRNEAAKAQVENQRKNIRKNYEFEWGDPGSSELGGEAKRRLDHAKEGLEILKRNTEADLAFQDGERLQNWQDAMAIRNYEDRQRERVYDKSVSRAIKQQTYTEIATQAALTDQDRLLNERLLEISFDETETLLQYGAAAAGLGLKKRQIKGAAATQAQGERISALKAKGASVARGVSGRSAGKQIQGLMAESGARQAAIIDELMFNTEGTDIDFLRLNRQYAIDQVAFETSRESARMADTAARSKIKMQELQALIDAEASIALKPEAQPPLTKPRILPRVEFQDVFEPGKPPMTTVADAAQENLFTAGISTVGSMVASAYTGGMAGQGTGAAFRGFNWGKAGLSMFG